MAELLKGQYQFPYIAHMKKLVPLVGINNSLFIPPKILKRLL
ncbi:hypothetical protein CDSM653_00389 [Caldanaerobacter subterraneus subsp. pacificus DSM 12653]|uniref:Uncharacterized protein n=1 Tax=Caldanaerobacter subterraneus subsp. pacificus DSM 12653 TaxID=391606 RepID=A0A0F5PRV0_9THEO|nr:hypothetical protein CDSM653_00389 [Caldanaerobacter subterraneus subsp. pacificus DSM 12653]